MTLAVRRRGLATALVFVTLVVGWTVREFQPTDAPIAAASSHTPLEPRIVASGTLQAVTTVQVGAQISGAVQSLGADYNSIVRAGEVIATLDPSLLEAALAEAQAALARALAVEAQAEADETGLEAAAGDAQTKLTRAESLASSQLIPQADLDSARTAVGEADVDLEGGESKIGEAKAAVLQARAAVGEATLDLDRTVIRSPIDGVVISRNVDVGQTVAASDVRGGIVPGRNVRRNGVAGAAATCGRHRRRLHRDRRRVESGRTTAARHDRHRDDGYFACNSSRIPPSDAMMPLVS
jgi:multidrug efflux pump subunit AcrA (membrane-fusion protein)